MSGSGITDTVFFQHLDDLIRSIHTGGDLCPMVLDQQEMEALVQALGFSAYQGESITDPEYAPLHQRIRGLLMAVGSTYGVVPESPDVLRHHGTARIYIRAVLDAVESWDGGHALVLGPFELSGMVTALGTMIRCFDQEDPEDPTHSRVRRLLNVIGSQYGIGAV